MFDLSNALADWRRQMLAAGIKTPVPLEELESHLRDDVGRAMSAQERRVTWILGAIIVAMDVAAGLVFLFNLHPFFVHIPFRERMLAAAACFIFPAIMWSWRYFCRFLPVVPSQRKRLAIWAASSVLGGFCTAILAQFIPQSDAFDGQYLGAQAWVFLPCVIGVTLIFGFEEAAYRKLATSGR